MENFSDQDHIFMQRAIDLARHAASLDEVPVGAVIVKEGKIIAEGFNTKEQGQACTRHAEINAIEAASKALNSWRLTKCSLFVSLEPCLMCAGAIVASRIDRLVYATTDPKAGAWGSCFNPSAHQFINHKPIIQSGLLAEHASEILKTFFQEKRKKTK